MEKTGRHGGSRMKKINMYFIGECIIIVLLLVIIGLLLKGKGTENLNQPAELSAKEVIVEEESNSVVDAAGSGIQKVADVFSGKDVLEAAEETPEETTVESVSDNNVVRISDVLEGKKIVVFGDSIWNDARGEDGVSEYLMALTGSTVYNCAIGGTSAAVIGESTEFSYDWRSQSFNGMVYVANKLLPADLVLEGTDACEVIKQVDFSTVDYILVSYGLNDFFSGVSIYPKEYYELTNYVGALRNGILHLREHYPQAKIVLVTPTYTKMFEGEKEFEIGDYVEAMRSVSQEMNTGLADMFHILGEDPGSRLEHLDDGVHLSAEGREIYANGIAWYLTEIEKEKQLME